VNHFAARLARWAAQRPDHLAVVDGARRVTYRELDALVAAVATALATEGVGPGDVVSSQLPNGLEAVALCLANDRLGCVHHPILATAGPRDVRAARADAGTARFVDDPDDPLLRRRPGATAVPGPSPAPADPEAPRFLLHTSGSTAEPKGVLHADRTLGAECAAQAAYHRLGADEVFVMPSPVAHTSGLLYGILLPIALGATAVLQDRWDPDRFLALVEAERGTFSGGATPFLQGLVDHPDRERFDLSSLRVFPCGGATVPPDLIRRARRLGIRAGRGYGSTEFPSITSGAGPGVPDDEAAETEGRPIGANEVRIVDGEIQARGPELFLGYRDARHDADAFTTDGWFRTGDLGQLDAGGRLILTGRATDVVIRLGENISAREVEDLLREHPGVADVAVVALPDARTGERACACVVPTAGSGAPSLADLTGFLRDRELSTRKLPEQVEVFDALPRSASGKVDKRALRARLEGRQPSEP
jgi:cyclohexanecarboxylate-CoA ligase